MAETFALPDGGSLAYDVHDYTDPWRTPDTVVLLHGFSKNRKFWFEWLPGLARRYRVIAVDQRGHGDSSPPPRDFRMALAPFVADLAAFFEGLGLFGAHVVAAEFSSKIGIELAIEHPALVRSLVLPGLIVGGSPVDTLPWAKLAEEQGAAAWARATVAMRLPADADPAMRDWYVAEQSRMQGWFLGALFRATPHMDLTGRLPLVPAPTLILAGAQSRQADPETTRRAAAAIPDCRLVEFPGMPFNVMSACPADCVRETLAFLEEVDGRRP